MTAPRQPKFLVDDDVHVPAARRLGTVVQTFYFMSENVTADEEAELQALPPLDHNQIRVRYFGIEEVVMLNEDEAVLLDRPLFHNDVVVKEDNLGKQLGTVIGIRTLADLVPVVEVQKLSTQSFPLFVDAIVSDSDIPQIMRGIDTRRLTLSMPIQNDDSLFHNNYVGVVHNYVTQAMVMFLSDRSICIIADTIETSLLAGNSLTWFESFGGWFPGAIISAPDHVWRSATWLKGAYTPDKHAGLVLEVGVNTRSIEMDWYPVGGYDTNSSDTLPENSDRPEEFLVNRTFVNGNFQMGDVVVIVADENGVPNGFRATIHGVAYNTSSATFVDPAALPSVDHSVTHRQATEELRKMWYSDTIDSSALPNFGHVMMIARTQTLVTIMWQDGTISENVDTRTVTPMTAYDEYEVFPGMFVERARAADEAEAEVPVQQCAIVRHSSATDRMATVQWLNDPDPLQSLRHCTLGDIETVSVYELIGHRLWYFQPTAFVVRIDDTMDLAPSDEQSQWINLCFQRCGFLQPPLIQLSKNVASYCGRIWDGKSQLPVLGRVFGAHPDAVILIVWWETGTFSLIRPEGLLLLEGAPWDDPGDTHAHDNGDDAAEDESYDDEDDDMSYDDENDDDDDTHPPFPRLYGGAGSLPTPWVPVNNDPEDAVSSTKGNRSDDHDGEDNDDSQWETDEEEGSNAGDRNDMEIDGDECRSTASSFPKDNAAAMDSSVGKRRRDSTNNVDGTGSSVLPTTPLIPQTRLSVKTIGAQAAEGLERFEQIASAPKDHHYAQDSVAPLQQAGEKSRRRRILQEHQSLATSLPEGIFVHTYEDNLDILRTIILGPPGTPYQDVLFWFDLMLPPEYPHMPPLCYFFSMTDGLGRINPNLYEDGKVCLSILNTWDGEGVERWTKESTILRVLISIQGLVLVKYPYFNETGFEIQRGTAEGQSNAVTYNERAFMLSMRTATAMLRHPPDDFVDLSRQYYIERGVLPALLRRCENLIQDAQHAEDDGSAIFSEEAVVINVSAGCKRMLNLSVQAMKKLLITEPPTTKISTS